MTITTDDEHAKLLRRFLTTLFAEDDKVYIFPCLSREKLKDVIDGKVSLPTHLHGKVLTYIPKTKEDDGQQWDEDTLTYCQSKLPTHLYQLGCHQPIHRRVLDPFSRKPSSTNTQLIAKLNAFVRLGYDIYFCCNPLTFGHRSQLTVRMARHIVLESDDASIPVEEQRKIFDQYKDAISAMTYSGNKSVHAFIRLSPPMWNVYPVTWKTKSRLRNKEEPYWEQYKEVARYWIDRIAKHGLKLDTSVAVDCSRLTRLPGFQHSKTGKPSELLYLNPASDFDWIWETQLAFSFDDKILLELSNKPEPTQVPELSSNQFNTNYKSNLIYQDNQSLPVLPDILNIVSNNNSQIKETLEPGKREERQRERKITSKTNVVHSGTVIDDLTNYNRLKIRGIQYRHIRRELHKVMFTAARVYGMAEDQMADSWRQIIGLHPDNIGCTAEKAVNELLESYRVNAKFAFFLPNTQNLPSLNKQKIKRLKDWLVSVECPCTNDCLKIIKDVLWDYIKTLPVQCSEGKVGIQSAVLHRICRGKGGYKRALAWLDENNVVKMTNENYCPGKMTRQYSINIPLLLYEAGFETADLDWDQSCKALKQPVALAEVAIAS